MEKPQHIIPEKIIGFKGPESESECTARDAILYALGVGFSDPNSQDHLKFLNEGSKSFTVFPTFATCLHHGDSLTPLVECPGMPAFNPLMILHAEHRLVINKPIRPGMKIRTTSSISNVQDKGKMTILTLKFDSLCEGQVLFSNQLSLIIRGLGGTSFKGTPGPAFKPKPFESVIEVATKPNQAIVYRLSGDRNPLHIDPDTAAIQRFEKPILHGLSTYDTVCRALVQKLLYNNSDFVKVFHARFVGHVFPGQRLKIGLWKQDGGWGFAASSVQRGKEVMVGRFEAEGVGSSL